MDEFAAALHDLKVFNRMIAAHPELAKRLIYGDYDFLQWRQARIFIAFRERHRRRQVGITEVSSRRAPWCALLLHIFFGLAAWLLMIWAVFARGKKDVLIFSVDKMSADKDHDFRIDDIYRFLKSEKISFSECFHAQLGMPLLKHACSRRRSAIYREAFEMAARAWLRVCGSSQEMRRYVAGLSCEAFKEADRPFIRELVERLLTGIAVSRCEIRGYRAILRRIRPRAILAIDDTRYYQELCAAARLEGVPFYAFQHGHFTKYHAGWLASGTSAGNDIRPDALHVWSPYWKKELVRLGTNFKAEEIRIGGNPKGEPTGGVQPIPYTPPRNGEILHLLVPFESDAPFEEVRAILKNLLAAARVKIWLKTRPDWDQQEQVCRYGLAGLPSNLVEAISDHSRVLSRIHAVAGVYSTFLYDMLPSMRPVFIFKTSMDFGEGMVLNDLADHLDILEGDSAAQLVTACLEAAPRLADRLKRYQGGTGNLRETLSSLLAAPVSD